MTDNEQRFLAEIAGRVNCDRIAEVHLFSALRQGGVESGVAVVAARAPEPDADGVAAGQGAEGTEEVTAPAATLLERFIVYSARYSHAFKGTERGKWSFEMAAEADAPLPAVDRVVNGVLARSGDQGEPVRLTAADVRAAIGDDACTATT